MEPGQCPRIPKDPTSQPPDSLWGNSRTHLPSPTEPSAFLLLFLRMETANLLSLWPPQWDGGKTTSSIGKLLFPDPRPSVAGGFLATKGEGQGGLRHCGCRVLHQVYLGSHPRVAPETLVTGPRLQSISVLGDTEGTSPTGLSTQPELAQTPFCTGTSSTRKTLRMILHT